MKRLYHLLIIIIPAIFIGLFVSDEEKLIQVSMWHIAIVIPIATIIRMRYYGLSMKKILISFIPFYGVRYRFEMFFNEKNEDRSNKR